MSPRGTVVLQRFGFLSTAGAKTRALGGHSSGVLARVWAQCLHNRICKGMGVPMLEGRIHTEFGIDHPNISKMEQGNE
jgi:hypothetical protein